ncbi:MAG: NAD(P)/FAD-dependent oxidoreductase [Thermodesulfovibrionales bacterium]
MTETGKTMVLGGGLAGLAAGCTLARAGAPVTVVERDSVVGGLSRTVQHDGYRFDLGGHRFFSTDETIDQFVSDLMAGELVRVERSSKILLRDCYFDYPLKPANALFGLGVGTSIRILADYGAEKVRGLASRGDSVSLEDWVVRNFGRTMFDIYFKVYSEKVWGIPCDRISAEWVDRRISGLSLATTIRNALFRMGGRKLPTLVDEFLYPRLGIGRIADRLQEEVCRTGEVLLGTCVKSIRHDNRNIETVTVETDGRTRVLGAEQFIASIPLTHLVRMLSPEPPAAVRAAASLLRYRDLVVVAVMVDRHRVTDQTWIYIPEERIPFGRIHEPTNWSPDMAPSGKTLVVAEYFSFQDDAVWRKADDELIGLTAENLQRLGFLKKSEVLGGSVVRVPKAYPLFEVGYREKCNEIYAWLAKFCNLHLTGRTGMFRYYNMDHALASGIRTAERVVAEAVPRPGECEDRRRALTA